MADLTNASSSKSSLSVKTILDLPLWVDQRHILQKILDEALADLTNASSSKSSLSVKTIFDLSLWG